MTLAPREPKQDRSRATRQRLLETTVEVLATRGWEASTVGLIATEAGISRGALQHHFPTREELVVAALEHIFEQRNAAALALRPPSRPGAAGVRELLGQIVDLFSDDLFRAALQVWTVAAADPVLRDRILPLERSFARRVHATTVTLLGADDDDPQVRTLIQATLDLARGLALADLLSDDSRRRARILDAWSAQLATVL